MNKFSNQTQLSIMIPIVVVSIVSVDKSDKTICLANCKSIEGGIADIHYTHTHTASATRGAPLRDKDKDALCKYSILGTRYSRWRLAQLRALVAAL